MNLIVLVIDSLRQDHVGLYHGGSGPFPDVAACRGRRTSTPSAGDVWFSRTRILRGCRRSRLATPS